jgi:hypothetical protein
VKGNADRPKISHFWDRTRFAQLSHNKHQAISFWIRKHLKNHATCTCMHRRRKHTLRTVYIDCCPSYIPGSTFYVITYIPVFSISFFIGIDNLFLMTFAFLVKIEEQCTTCISLRFQARVYMYFLLLLFFISI